MSLYIYCHYTLSYTSTGHSYYNFSLKYKFLNNIEGKFEVYKNSFHVISSIDDSVKLHISH